MSKQWPGNCFPNTIGYNANHVKRIKQRIWVCVCIGRVAIASNNIWTRSTSNRLSNEEELLFAELVSTYPKHVPCIHCQRGWRRIMVWMRMPWYYEIRVSFILHPYIVLFWLTCQWTIIQNMCNTLNDIHMVRNR